MKYKWIHIALLISFLICYMEWGGSQSSTIFEMIITVFQKQHNLFSTLIHPVILFGMVGIVIQVIALIVVKPNKRINLLGIFSMGIVVFLILVAGLFSLNYKMILSIIPFVICVIIFVKQSIIQKK